MGGKLSKKGKYDAMKTKKKKAGSKFIFKNHHERDHFLYDENTSRLGEGHRMASLTLPNLTDLRNDSWRKRRVDPKTRITVDGSKMYSEASMRSEDYETISVSLHDIPTEYTDDEENRYEEVQDYRRDSEDISKTEISKDLDDSIADIDIDEVVQKLKHIKRRIKLFDGKENYKNIIEDLDLCADELNAVDTTTELTRELVVHLNRKIKNFKNAINEKQLKLNPIKINVDTGEDQSKIHYQSVVKLFAEITNELDDIKEEILNYYGTSEDEEYTIIMNKLNRSLLLVREVEPKGNVNIILTKEQYEDYINRLKKQFEVIVEESEKNFKLQKHTLSTIDRSRDRRRRSQILDNNINIKEVHGRLSVDHSSMFRPPRLSSASKAVIEEEEDINKSDEQLYLSEPKLEDDNGQEFYAQVVKVDDEQVIYEKQVPKKSVVDDNNFEMVLRNKESKSKPLSPLRKNFHRQISGYSTEAEDEFFDCEEFLEDGVIPASETFNEFNNYSQVEVSDDSRKYSPVEIGHGNIPLVERNLSFIDDSQENLDEEKPSFKSIFGRSVSDQSSKSDEGFNSDSTKVENLDNQVEYVKIIGEDKTEDLDILRPNEETPTKQKHNTNSHEQLEYSSDTEEHDTEEHEKMKTVHNEKRKLCRESSTVEEDLEDIQTYIKSLKPPENNLNKPNFGEEGNQDESLEGAKVIKGPRKVSRITMKYIDGLKHDYAESLKQLSPALCDDDDDDGGGFNFVEVVNKNIEKDRSFVNVNEDGKVKDGNGSNIFVNDQMENFEDSLQKDDGEDGFLEVTKDERKYNESDEGGILEDTNGSIEERDYNNLDINEDNNIAKEKLSEGNQIDFEGNFEAELINRDFKNNDVEPDFASVTDSEEYFEDVDLTVSNVTREPTYKDNLTTNTTHHPNSDNLGSQNEFKDFEEISAKSKFEDSKCDQTDSSINTNQLNGDEKSLQYDLNNFEEIRANFEDSKKIINSHQTKPIVTQGITKDIDENLIENDFKSREENLESVSNTRDEDRKETDQNDSEEVIMRGNTSKNTSLEEMKEKTASVLSFITDDEINAIANSNLFEEDRLFRKFSITQKDKSDKNPFNEFTNDFKVDSLQSTEQKSDATLNRSYLESLNESNFKEDDISEHQTSLSTEAQSEDRDVYSIKDNPFKKFDDYLRELKPPSVEPPKTPRNSVELSFDQQEHIFEREYKDPSIFSGQYEYIKESANYINAKELDPSRERNDNLNTEWIEFLDQPKLTHSSLGNSENLNEDTALDNFFTLDTKFNDEINNASIKEGKEGTDNSLENLDIKEIKESLNSRNNNDNVDSNTSTLISENTNIFYQQNSSPHHGLDWQELHDKPLAYNDALIHTTREEMSPEIFGHNRIEPSDLKEEEIFGHNRIEPSDIKEEDIFEHNHIEPSDHKEDEIFGHNRIEPSNLKEEEIFGLNRMEPSNLKKEEIFGHNRIEPSDLKEEDNVDPKINKNRKLEDLLRERIIRKEIPVEKNNTPINPFIALADDTNNDKSTKSRNTNNNQNEQLIDLNNEDLDFHDIQNRSSISKDDEPTNFRNDTAEDAFFDVIDSNVTDSKISVDKDNTPNTEIGNERTNFILGMDYGIVDDKEIIYSNSSLDSNFKIPGDYMNSVSSTKNFKHGSNFKNPDINVEPVKAKNLKLNSDENTRSQVKIPENKNLNTDDQTEYTDSSLDFLDEERDVVAELPSLSRSYLSDDDAGEIETKLKTVKECMEDITICIRCFEGTKNDEEYDNIYENLFSAMSILNKIKSSDWEVIQEKQSILQEITKCMNDLEAMTE